MIESLNKDLAEITGFAAISAQPNSGAQVKIIIMIR
jgi:glycine dehydrogenase